MGVPMLPVETVAMISTRYLVVGNNSQSVLEKPSESDYTVSDREIIPVDGAEFALSCPVNLGGLLTIAHRAFPSRDTQRLANCGERGLQLICSNVRDDSQ